MTAMTINLRVPDLTELKPRITVFGVGGAGGNAVNNMIEGGLKGVEFVVANTDAQALASSTAERRIQMGANVTEGLGAGSKPEVGAAVANEKTTFTDAFAMADDVLRAGVSCITDLMVKEGLINLDFADVRTIMAGMGKAMMGTGESSGDRRAIEAAEAAISNPLLDDVSMKGASGLLVSITVGSDLTLYEVDEAASRIRAEADPDANIIVGATYDDELDGSIRVSVVGTGIWLSL